MSETNNEEFKNSCLKVKLLIQDVVVKEIEKHSNTNEQLVLLSVAHSNILQEIKKILMKDHLEEDAITILSYMLSIAENHFKQPNNAN